MAKLHLYYLRACLRLVVTSVMSDIGQPLTEQEWTNVDLHRFGAVLTSQL